MFADIAATQNDIG